MEFTSLLYFNLIILLWGRCIQCLVYPSGVKNKTFISDTFNSTMNDGRKMIDGYTDLLKKYPYIVRLILTENDTEFVDIQNANLCVGVVIDPNFVLTDNVCFYRTVNNKTAKMQRMYMVINTGIISTVEEENVIECEYVASIGMLIGGIIGLRLKDLGLLKFYEDFKGKPITLPRIKDEGIGHHYNRLVLVAFTRPDKFTLEDIELVQTLEVKFERDSYCKEVNSAYDPTMHYCFDGSNGRPIPADSGAPIVGITKGGEHILLGVYTEVINNNNDLGPFFARRVDYYVIMMNAEMYFGRNYVQGKLINKLRRYIDNW